MKLPRRIHAEAYTLIEHFVVVGVLAVSAVVVLSTFPRPRCTCQRINCVNNLKQVGLAFRTWALDNHDLFPMGVSTDTGGSEEYLATGETFRHFQVMSNELSTPRSLFCPADSRRPAQAFASGFANSNLSYFVGVVTNGGNPQMLLSGDRNITGGVWLAHGIVEMTTNDLVGWTASMHRGAGNVGLADGSVQQLSTSRLQEALKWTGVATNRLAFP